MERKCLGHQIVKGYEYEEGKFVVLKEEDFQRVDVEATQTVDIIDFVQLSEINPMFFSKPFYMEPAKGGAKAYALLREALRETGKVGISKVVIKTRQYLASVKPNENALLLELMHFADELAETNSLQLPSAKGGGGKGEMNIAKELIARMTDKWEPEKYKDDYRSALLELIEKKIASGGRELKTPQPKRKAATNVIDLVDVLKRSLGEAAKPANRKVRADRSAQKKSKRAA